MPEKEKRIEVCTCENCGSEAEMVITCEFVPVEAENKTVKKERRHVSCKHCGNEADMIIEE